ncbi:putative methyltransferase DDB_G0268948 [Clavelina lepadiformis]|uniref:putative methyltransferase DDB_G0268948 n=1 Tax=Clavelina lepadiformis TaxID=159417 RepID=UPI0040413798
MTSLYQHSDVVDAYFKHRPVYSDDVAQTVMKYLQRRDEVHDSSSTYDLMVDVGCGSGQATNIFAAYFKKIVGLDASENQIKVAKKQNKFDHINYVVGKAEELPFKEGSVDLLVCGEAVHWFDLPKFFREVSRVLKPEGCIAIIGYWVQSINRLRLIQNNPSSFKETLNLFVDLARLGMSNHSRQDWIVEEVTTGYKDIFAKIPFPSKERRDDIFIKNVVTFSDLCGFLASTMDLGDLETKEDQLDEIFGVMMEVDIGSFDPLQAITNKMMKIWNVGNKEEKFEIDFNVYILLSKLGQSQKHKAQKKSPI